MAALSLKTAFSAQAATQITSLPFFVTTPGTYILASDLTYSGSSIGAINIPVNLPGPVAVNFKGHSITASSPGNGNFGVFIFGPGPSTSTITVQNGSLNGFYFGCWVEPNNATLLSGITLDHLVITRTSSLSGAGINLIFVQNSTVTNCSFIDCAAAIETDRTANGDRFSNITFTNCGTALAIAESGLLDTCRFEPAP